MLAYTIAKMTVGKGYFSEINTESCQKSIQSAKPYTQSVYQVSVLAVEFLEIFCSQSDLLHTLTMLRKGHNSVKYIKSLAKS